MTEIPEHLRRRAAAARDNAESLAGALNPNDPFPPDTSDGEPVNKIQLKRSEDPGIWSWRIVDHVGKVVKQGSELGRGGAMVRAQRVLADLDQYQWHDA